MMIDSILSVKKKLMIVSRASTAIYLILKSNNLAGKKVLFPANICYAAVYPAIYAGCDPVFCDVDYNTGNVSFSIFEENCQGISAAVVPHMYGNPIKDMIEIAEYCRVNGILLVEDCASVLGGRVKDKWCGSFGDYSIFSTGYAKTIDIGYGGFLLTDRDTLEIKKLYEGLPRKSGECDINTSFFSKLYRLIRNSTDQSISHHIWKALRNQLKDLFVNRIDIDNEEYLGKLCDLEDIVRLRCSNNELYEENIIKCDGINNYCWNEGAVPWRFNIIVEPSIRNGMIDYLLSKNIPVSDWYPNVTPIFGKKVAFHNADSFENRIINFPLTLDKENIVNICKEINYYMELTNK